MALVRSVKPRNYHKGSFVSVQVETLATIGCARHNWVRSGINRMLLIRHTWESEKIGRGACECVLGIDDLQRPAISFHGIPLNPRFHCVIYEQYIIPCSGILRIHQFNAARSMIDLRQCSRFRERLYRSGFRCKTDQVRREAQTHGGELLLIEVFSHRQQPPMVETTSTMSPHNMNAWRLSYPINKSATNIAGGILRYYILNTNAFFESMRITLLTRYLPQVVADRFKHYRNDQHQKSDALRRFHHCCRPFDIRHISHSRTYGCIRFLVLKVKK